MLESGKRVLKYARRVEECDWRGSPALVETHVHAGRDLNDTPWSSDGGQKALGTSEGAEGF